MADDHSNPPRLPGPIATVQEMATAAGMRCSEKSAKEAQYRFMVRAIGGDILNDLPAFYWADGSLTQLTRDHKYWSQVGAYLEDRTTGSVYNRRTFHTEEIRTNREWIEKVIVKKTDYAKLLRSRGEPMPEWWPASADYDPNGWPWGSYETGSLRKLANAAHNFWTTYDPSNPSTAPTNGEVITWLKDQGVSQRIAEAMAQILRADGLPRGPRK